MKKKKSYVIAIAGASGSGKSNLAEKLAKELKGAIMYFDRYSHMMEYTTIEGRKLEENEGPNPNNLMITRMVEDLKFLKEGKTINEPISKRKVRSKKYIVIEDPHGRERLDIAPLYDLVILVDTPLEICLARVLLRAFSGKYFMREGTGELVAQEKADPKEKLDVFEKFISGQYWKREYYIAINDFVRKSADLTLDGLQSIEAMTEEVISRIKEGKN